MELLRHATSTQILYPAAAVAVVLLCAALVFILGFHSAEQPQFDKLPLVVDDRKSASKKRKNKDKKSSPNRGANEDGKTKSDSKKSPVKEKKEVKETEKQKPKEKSVEPKQAKKEEVKKTKKVKNVEAEKPADFDEGVWEEVPKKSEKKKVKSTEEKKDSPTKKNKKKTKDTDVEAAQLTPEVSEYKVVISKGPEVDEEAARALQAQVAEMQRVLKEVELREQAALGHITLEADDDAAAEELVEELAEVKDLRSNKKKENKEKQKKKSIEAGKGKGESAEIDTTEVIEQPNENQNVAVFDELGDSWTDTKAKKGKKKARKEQ